MNKEEEVTILKWMEASKVLETKCSNSKDYDKWLDRYDKLWWKVLDIIVDKATADKVLGNLLYRISKYIEGACNNKGRLL